MRACVCLCVSMWNTQLLLKQLWQSLELINECIPLGSISQGNGCEECWKFNLCLTLNDQQSIECYFCIELVWEQLWSTFLILCLMFFSYSWEPGIPSSRGRGETSIHLQHCSLEQASLSVATSCKPPQNPTPLPQKGKKCSDLDAYFVFLDILLK